MTEVTGGLRARLLQDSLVAVVDEILNDNGWFDAGRHHRPIRVLAKPVTWDEPVALNTLAISTASRYGQDAELGSDLSTDTVHVSLDFFAENDAIGVHLSNDLRDGLRGRLPVGADGGVFPIYDYRLATPVSIGTGVIAMVEIVRQIAPTTEEWTSHVHSVVCDVEDTYYGVATGTEAYPGADLVPGPDLYPIGA